MLACCCVGAASAETFASTSYRLHAPTPSGLGGASTSTVANAEVGELRGTGGQASPTGRSIGVASGIALEGGFRPVLRFVPEPSTTISLIGGLALLGGLRNRRRRVVGSR